MERVLGKMDFWSKVELNSNLNGDFAAIHEDTPYSANYEIEQYFVYPGFNNDFGKNDIAVVLTKKYISFNRGVGVSCMPSLDES